MARLAPVPVVTPPARWVWGYRLLGLRVPPEYRRWVAQEIGTSRSLRRAMGLRIVVAAPLYGALMLVNVLAGRSIAGLMGALAGLLVASQLFAGRRRSGELAFQRIDAAGRPVPATGRFKLDNDTSLLLVAVVLVGFLGVYAVLVGAVEG